MSRVDELILELCGDGVPFVALGDVAETVPGLKGKTKVDFSDGNARFVTYKNAFANIVVDQDAPNFVKVSPTENQNRLHLGDVIFTGSSENIADVGMSSVVASEPRDPLYLNSFCFIVRFKKPDMLIPGFSKYLFRSDLVRKQIRLTASGVTRINVSKGRFMKVRIPVPPLEVQREILRILDQFTQLEAELKAELEAELDARRRQFVHYRRMVMAPASHWVTTRLGDVVEFQNAKAHERLIDPDGDITLLTAGFISAGVSKARFVRSEDVLTPALLDDVAMVMSDLPNGRALAKAFFVDKVNMYAANQRVCLLRPKSTNQLDPKFLYYTVNRNAQLLAYDSGVDQTHLKKDWILDIRIGIPPVEEQRRITKTLDEFDALVNDLCVGLPAELAARRKQYEYYRDQLLTFKEAA